MTALYTDSDLDRALDSLCARYGDLEISAPDPHGSVGIVCHEASKSWRFTAMNGLVADPDPTAERRS